MLDQARLISRFIWDIRAQVNSELQKWQVQARQIPDPDLRKQALDSLHHKKFHAFGGSIYALWHPQWAKVLIPLIVAVQTISDYLDNLCDRMDITEGQAFQTLHLAFKQSLRPASSLSDYYAGYPQGEDGGYLKQLVLTAQNQVQCLPSFAICQEKIEVLADLYSELQVRKHLAIPVREEHLRQWAQIQGEIYPDLYWWEFSAATGSTLGIFALLSAATQDSLEEEPCHQLFQAYFPWISGLHILLDYFIDQEEDRKEKDLNFFTYYPEAEMIHKRLLEFIQQATQRAKSLPNSTFHYTVVQGLLALYLSDPKINAQNLKQAAQTLVKQGGKPAERMFSLCRNMRQFGLV